jgi:hypothetical protein
MTRKRTNPQATLPLKADDPEMAAWKERHRRSLHELFMAEGIMPTTDDEKARLEYGPGADG